ncbi:MAG: DUF2284 domain-containing protein [Oscillospiraceae bacterium]|nr:DUF2284 domain-containing protein [Oscillospiraceae bacterium]
MNDLERLRRIALDLGAYRTGAVKVDEIHFEPEFRKLCESNACGMYGKSWMCPPDIGPVEDLIAQAKQFRQALVFQTVDTLADSYDFEGMMAAGEKMNRLMAAVRQQADEMGLRRRLLLGAGGCRVCQRCAKVNGQPCLYPGQALSSLEAYGINVSVLAPQAGMKYINGPNTVTFFGAVLIGET